MKNKLQKNVTFNLPGTISSLKQEKHDNGLGLVFEGVYWACRTTPSDTCGTGSHGFLCKETVVHVESVNYYRKLSIMMHQLGQQASTCLSFSSLPNNISNPF